MDAELRKAIAKHIPSIEDQENAIAVDAVVRRGVEEAKKEAGGDGDSKAKPGLHPLRPGAVALPPATLARALPHLRRLMPRRGDSSNGGKGVNGEGERVLGALDLLQGGRVVFPMARKAAEAPLKEGEVSTARCGALRLTALGRPPPPSETNDFGLMPCRSSQQESFSTN